MGRSLTTDPRLDIATVDRAHREQVLQVDEVGNHSGHEKGNRKAMIKPKSRKHEERINALEEYSRTQFELLRRLNDSIKFIEKERRQEKIDALNRQSKPWWHLW